MLCTYQQHVEERQRVAGAKFAQQQHRHGPKRPVAVLRTQIQQVRSNRGVGARQQRAQVAQARAHAGIDIRQEAGALRVDERSKGGERARLVVGVDAQHARRELRHALRVPDCGVVQSVGAQQASEAQSRRLQVARALQRRARHVRRDDAARCGVLAVRLRLVATPQKRLVRRGICNCVAAPQQEPSRRPLLRQQPAAVLQRDGQGIAPRGGRGSTLVISQRSQAAALTLKRVINAFRHPRGADRSSDARRKELHAAWRHVGGARSAALLAPRAAS